MKRPALPQERAPADPGLSAARGSVPSPGSAAGQETSVPVLGYLCPAAIARPRTKANPNRSGTGSSPPAPPGKGPQAGGDTRVHACTARAAYEECFGEAQRLLSHFNQKPCRLGSCHFRLATKIQGKKPQTTRKSPPQQGLLTQTRSSGPGHQFSSSSVQRCSSTSGLRENTPPALSEGLHKLPC